MLQKYRRIQIKKYPRHKIYVDIAQKAKVKWAIKRDENSKFFHEFYNHFANKFSAPDWFRALMEVGEDVSTTVNEFFNSSIFPNCCNPSFIALIPKVLDAKRLGDFRPVSLIGCKQILDGPIIPNEILSWCKSRKKQALLFIVDFQKAFNLVKWDHPFDILGKFIFGGKWRWWIRGCLHSLKASVLVNGSPTDELFESQHAQSSLYGLGVHSLGVQSMANSFGCLENNILFTYLGVKVTANMAHISSWNEVIQKVTFKVSKWKAKSDASVAQKFQNPDFAVSFRRPPKGGSEESQFQELPLSYFPRLFYSLLAIVSLGH
ncbi:hypothetical protein Tco_1400546 [Tanacetum coccineum]